MSSRLNVGIFLFDAMTMLDAYGPLQFFSFVERFNAFTFAKEKKGIQSDCGALLTPHYGFSDCPDLDILVVPGGANVLAQMIDAEVQAFIGRQGTQAKYVTSVCTGALILAEAGLLNGYRATTHWSALDQLATFPAIEVVDERVVVDRNRITGGGVTAGIDFALTLIAEVVAPEMAQVAQLVYEYRPQPPFNAGSPRTAPPELVANVRGMVREMAADLIAHVSARN